MEARYFQNLVHVELQISFSQGWEELLVVLVIYVFED